MVIDCYFNIRFPTPEINTNPPLRAPCHSGKEVQEDVTLVALIRFGPDIFTSEITLLSNPLPPFASGNRNARQPDNAINPQNKKAPYPKE